MVGRIQSPHSDRREKDINLQMEVQMGGTKVAGRNISGGS